MKRVTLLLAEGAYDALRREAYERHVSMVAILRERLSGEVAEKARPKARTVAAAAQAEGFASTRVSLEEQERNHCCCAGLTQEERTKAGPHHRNQNCDWRG